jgi:hypothetical protein
MHIINLITGHSSLSISPFTAALSSISSHCWRFHYNRHIEEHLCNQRRWKRKSATGATSAGKPFVYIDDVLCPHHKLRSQPLSMEISPQPTRRQYTVIHMYVGVQYLAYLKDRDMTTRGGE